MKPFLYVANENAATALAAVLENSAEINFDDEMEETARAQDTLASFVNQLSAFPVIVTFDVDVCSLDLLASAVEATQDEASEADEDEEYSPNDVALVSSAKIEALKTTLARATEVR